MIIRTLIDKIHLDFRMYVQKGNSSVDLQHLVSFDKTLIFDIK